MKTNILYLIHGFVVSKYKLRKRFLKQLNNIYIYIYTHTHTYTSEINASVPGM